MRPAVKLLFFFVMVFLIGIVYNSLNMGLVPLEETIANTSSLPQNPYPTVTLVYNYLWLAIPIIGIVSTAIYLSSNPQGGRI